MQVTPSLQSWLEHLRLLTPITGLVHVGAGTGQAIGHYAEWGVPSAVLIEAEASCHDKLAAAASGHPGWSAHTALLSDQVEERDFYLASNPNENSILPPEGLTSLWRNLKTKEQRLLNASTLDGLLTALNLQSETVNWVVIDCLPALPVLRGAGQRLDDWDVIVVRVVLDQAQLQAAGVSKAEVDAFLSEHGYRCIICEEERQPAVGRALYVRDWKVLLHARLQRLQRDAAIQAEASAELQKSLDEQILLLTECQQRMARLTKTSEDQTKLAGERQAQLEQLTKAKEEQTKLAAERQQQLAQLTKASEEQTKLTAERQKQVVDTQERLQQIQVQNKELASRQALLQEELVRAEAQIDLIKDVLLPESSL